MTRKFFVGGNWKMNGSKASNASLVATLNTIPISPLLEVVVCPPAVYLSSVRESIKKEIGVGAQNIYTELSGAFTGETSASFLLDVGAEWVILGHSERREIFKESDELVAKKVAFAIRSGLRVIACVGENLGERESGQTKHVVIRQLEAIAQHVSDLSNVVIAYEPVWAIGTGKVATPEQAQEVHKEIRTFLSSRYAPAVAATTRIIYGGSVNGKNSGDLAKQTDVDGFLVGGASLKPEFVDICASHSVEKLK